MKKYQQTIQQYVILSLLVVYQCIGLIHIAYLPRQNDIGNLHSPSSIDFLRKNSNTSSPRAQYQRIFYAAESRRDLSIPVRVFVLFFAFLLIGSITLITAKKPDGALAAVYSHKPPSFLSLRTLRI